MTKVDYERLRKALRSLKREKMPTFWTVAEEDPGGMLGGGGPTYLMDDPNPYHSTSEYQPHLAKKFASRAEAEASDAWKKWGPFAPKYWIEEVSTWYPRVALTEDELVFLLETALDPVLIENVESIKKAERTRISDAMHEANKTLDYEVE